MNRILFAPLLLSAGLTAGCQDDKGRPRYEILPGMVDSVPYDSFARNPLTRDGKTLLAPVKGTVPRGFTPFRYGHDPKEAERAGRELANPLPPTPEVLARGEKVFQTYCYECHGRGGLGDGPMVPKFPQPPSLLAAHARDYPDGRIFHVITSGQGLMPSHAGQVSASDRWKAIHYLRTLQAAAKKGAPK